MATKKKVTRKPRTRSKASAISEDSTPKEIKKVVKKAVRKAEKKTTKKVANARVSKPSFSFEDIKDVKGVKEYKFDILNKANREKVKYEYRIPFNNIALQSISGGIIGGTFCELGAESQGGKSFLAYELMANTQAMGGVVILNDGEGAFDENYAKMVGLNIDDGTFIITRIANIQKYYSFQINVITAIRKQKGCKQIPILSVCDSFPTLNTKYALDARGGGEQLGFESKLKNRAWSEQMETFVPFLKDTMATHIMINQFTKVEVANKYMNNNVSLCESKMQYWATQRFKGMLKGNITKEVWIGPKSGKKNCKKVKIGMRTEWESIKNRSVKPFQKAVVDILYSHGISKYSGLVKMLMDNEMLMIKGSKFCANTGEELSKAKDYLQALPKLVGEEDVRITFHKALGSSNKELAKLIKDYPKAIEPIWTGSYDDGETYEVEDFSDEELNERNSPLVTDDEAVEA
jgi:recombination protein RecA